jgi:hypothetical protein
MSVLGDTSACYASWGFWLRVVVLSVVCSPVLCGQDLPLAPEPLFVETAQVERPELFVPPAAEALAQEISEGAQYEPALLDPNFTLPPTPAPFVGDASCPNYWIVSSRCSTQRLDTPGRWGLDSFQRFPDGRFCATDLTTLSSQIVPGIPVCIFVHGSFVKWESQAREAEEAYQQFRCACPNQPVQLIFFTWPSDGPYTYLLPLDAGIRGEKAEVNGFHLAHLISYLPENCPVCLIGHSHGTRAVLSALHLAGGGSIKGHCFSGNMGNRRYRAILAAAAVDHFWLNPGNRFGCALHRTECLLHLKNSKDFPLAFYQFSHPFAGRALARSGFTRRDVDRIGNQASKIRECDVSTVIGADHLWPEYFRQQSIVSSMTPYIYFF